MSVGVWLVVDGVCVAVGWFMVLVAYECVCVWFDVDGVWLRECVFWW